MNKEEINVLNKEHTFETFIVGNSNRFAYQAALAVAETPGESYNPLFIYGKNGTGKTHLMHAIGNEILKNNKKAKVLYVTAEQIDIIKNEYKNVDVLLIDNIQFLAGKEKTQEKLVNVLEYIHENGKQVIISSDRPQKDINLLEDRLKSRFEWELIADIDVPEYETRLEILKKKAEIKTHR